MKPVFIYCLRDPETGFVRYIGKTDEPKKRLSRHLSTSSKMKTHLGNWLRSLAVGKPVLVVLHAVAKNECWQEEERRYISCARALGMDLVNATDGGEGSSMPCSPERRAALRAGWTLERRAAKSAATKGVPHSTEHRAAISAAKMGVPLSPEHCAAMSAATKGVPKSPETRAAMSAGWTPECRAAKSAAMTGARRASSVKGAIFNK